MSALVFTIIVVALMALADRWLKRRGSKFRAAWQQSRDEHPLWVAIGIGGVTLIVVLLQEALVGDRRWWLAAGYSFLVVLGVWVMSILTSLSKDDID